MHGTKCDNNNNLMCKEAKLLNGEFNFLCNSLLYILFCESFEIMLDERHHGKSFNA